MRNFAFYLSFFLIAILSISCNVNSNNKESSSIDISQGYQQELVEIPCSSMIDSFNYIKLVSEKPAAFDRIIDLQYYDNMIFILSGRYDKIHIFNVDGSLDQVIHKRGRGPGEYLQISDFCYNADNHEIVVIDQAMQKAICYSLINNDYREFRLPNKFIRIEKYRDIYVLRVKPELLNDKWPHYLYTTDFNFNEIERLEYTQIYKKYPQRVRRNSDFFLIRDNLVFWNLFGDTLSTYSLSSKQKMVLNYRMNIVNNVNPVPIDRYLDLLNFNGYMRTFHTDNFLIFKANKKKQPVYIFYSFKHKNCISSNLFETFGLINDIDGGPNFFPHGMAGKNTFYQVINPGSKNTTVHNPGFYQKQIFNSLKPSDNPIIQLAFFKNHETVK